MQFRQRPKLRTWQVAALVLLVLWMPYCWLVFIDYPWSDYRWFWIERWPVLPGLPSMLVVRPLGIESSGTETLMMGCMTALLAFVAVVAARRSHRWLIGTLTVLAAYGVFMCFASHAVFST